MGSRAVFISYSRSSTGDAAAAIAADLPPDSTFLDQSAMLPGEPISSAIVDAALHARVLVCLLSDDFFSRPYCQAEFDIALARWEALESLPPMSRGVVLALPSGRQDALLDRLPQDMRDIHWPAPEQTAALVALIQRELSIDASQSLAALLPPLAQEQLRALATAKTAIPPRAISLDPRLTFGVPQLALSPFVGREMLLRSLLHQLVSPAGSRMAGIIGPEGTGKTRVAAEFVWRYSTSYFTGGVYWLQVGQPDLWDPQVHALLCHLDPGTPALKDLLSQHTDLMHLLGQTLQRQGSSPKLLVLDGITPDRAFMVGQSLRPSAHESSALLFTAQELLPPPVTNIALPPLPRWASRELLTAGAGKRLPLPLADQLAARLGDWPLAIDLLQIALTTGAFDTSHVSLLLEGETVTPLLAETADLLHTMLPSVPLPAIGHSLALSLAALDPPALALASHLAWLDDAPIPLPLIEVLEAQGIPRTARTTLRMRGWIMPSSEESYGKIHPFLADFLRSLPTSRESLLPLAQCLRRMQQAHDCGLASTIGLLLALAPHVLRVARHPSLPIRLQLELLGEVAFLQETLWQRQPTLALRQEIWQRAQAAAEADPTLALQYEYELAVSLFEFMESALTPGWLEDMAARALATLGPGDELTLNIQFLLAKHLKDRQQDLKGARLLFESVRERRRQLPCPVAASNATSLRELGLIALVENDLAGAIALLKEAIGAAQATVGADHNLTHDCAHHLAMALLFAGEYEEAFPISEQALKSRQAMLGWQGLSTLATAHNHAELLYLRGALDASALLFTEVARSRAAVLGPQDSRALNSLAHAWRVRGVRGEEFALRELSALEVRLTAAMGTSHSWPRKVRGFAAQVACWQGDADPAGCDAVSVVQEELDAASPVVSQLAQLLTTVGWRALKALAHASDFLQLLDEATPVMDLRMSHGHPTRLLLECQRQLLLGHQVKALGALAARLGTDHWEVEALYRTTRHPSAVPRER